MITHFNNIGCLFTWDSKNKCIHQQDNIDILVKDGVIIDKGSPEELIQKHGRQNLEEVFLKLSRSKDEYN